MIAFTYFIQIIGIQECLQNAITETGYYAAKYAYVYDYLIHYEQADAVKVGESLENGEGTNQNNIESGIETVIAHTIDSAFYKIKMQDYLDVEKVNHSCIKNGFFGVNTYLSSYMEEEDTIDIILSYNIKLPLLFFDLDNIQMVQRVRLRGWSGHKVSVKNAVIENPEDNEDKVFITEKGTVYHLTKECTHLKLSITEVEIELVETLRNDSGGKYKKCLVCGGSGKSTENDSVYVTNTGDRYHWNLDCSGLKRTIIAIPLSEVGGRSLCKRCAQ